MTPPERVAAVEALGFTPPQATFLTTVALHSGYCVRRQYAACTGVKSEKMAREFLNGLVERKLADRIMFRADRGSIYHLFGRRVYAAIGDSNHRNRRHASPPLIARRLMLLDFVIAYPEFDWHATDADKRALLVTRFGVPESTRLTTEKLSIFVRGASPAVNFACIVTDPRASAIDAFLHEHTALVRHLKDWTLHAVIPQRVATDESCEAAYRRALAAVSMMSVSIEDLDWFTNTRSLVTSGDLRTLGMDELNRYRTLSKTLGQRLETHSVNPLAIHHLPHSYRQFGSMAGLS